MIFRYISYLSIDVALGALAVGIYFWKILDRNIRVTATAVRVPVTGGHSEAVNVEFATEFQITDVLKALEATPGITVQDDPAHDVYPMPMHANGKDAVFVGRQPCARGLAPVRHHLVQQEVWPPCAGVGEIRHGCPATLPRPHLGKYRFHSPTGTSILVLRRRA